MVKRKKSFTLLYGEESTTIEFNAGTMYTVAQLLWDHPFSPMHSLVRVNRGEERFTPCSGGFQLVSHGYPCVERAVNQKVRWNPNFEILNGDVVVVLPCYVYASGPLPEEVAKTWYGEKP